MADNCTESKPKPHQIFVYGTLKRDFPNHHLMQSLIQENDAVFLGHHVTHQSFPLVCGPQGIPYLINLPGSGQRIRGELYSVSTTRGLARLDDLEGTTVGHYDRLPIQVVQPDGDGGVLVEAEAYYAHGSYGEGLWEKKGREGLSEYTQREASGYVRKENRATATGTSYADELRLFVSSAAK